jgi:hypothetical protein
MNRSGKGACSCLFETAEPPYLKTDGRDAFVFYSGSLQAGFSRHCIVMNV